MSDQNNEYEYDSNTKLFSPGVLLIIFWIVVMSVVVFTYSGDEAVTIEFSINNTSSQVELPAYHVNYDSFVESLHQQSVDHNELLCLQKNIFFEARSEDIEGQYAVAHVTRNRVLSARYPNTYCGVVYQPSQFSWFKGVDLWPDFSNTIEKSAWEEIRKVAEDVYYDKVESPLPNVLHYHSTSVKPFWSKSRRKSEFATIGNHIFYQFNG